MCLIVDNDSVRRVLVLINDPDFGALHACLLGGKLPRVRIAYGGELAREYQGNQEVLRLVAALDRAGRARKVPDDAIDQEREIVRQSGLCASNDHHIIALARVAGVRLLCSCDQALQGDFKNRHLLNNPRGKVYRRRSHRALLIEACGHL